MEKYLNKIVTLDLVNGKEITTRILEINDNIITCSKPLIFVPIPDEHNRQNMQIMALPYGHPMYDVGKTIEINTNHVITVFTPTIEQQESYAKHTGTIVAVPPSAIDQLDSIDFSKFSL
jgi:hypothetical protein